MDPGGYSGEVAAIKKHDGPYINKPGGKRGAASVVGSEALVALTSEMGISETSENLNAVKENMGRLKKAMENKIVEERP